MIVKVKLIGTSPLVMHANTLANPLHPMKKKIAALTGKRKKTDSDHIEIARLEFIAGMYHDKERGPYIPRQNIRKMLIEAARKDKNGKQFEQGIYIVDDAPLEYDGPRDIQGLYEAVDEDENPQFCWSTIVGNQKSSILRTRPRFTDWGCEFEVEIVPELVDMPTFETALDKAKISGGLCDARVLGYGRFSPTVLEQETNGRIRKDELVASR